MVHCAAGPVFGLGSSEARDAAFYTALTIARQATETSAAASLALMETAWQEGSALVRAAAANHLLTAMVEANYSNEDYRRLLKTGQALSRRYPDDWSVRLVVARCLAALADKAGLAALYANLGVRQLSEADRIILALERWQADPASGQLELEQLFLGASLNDEKRRFYQLIVTSEPVFNFSLSGQAIRGRLAVYDQAYGSGLRLFQAVLAEDESLFLAYPELLADLGRAYQYTSNSSAAEGWQFFKQLLESGRQLSNDSRYRLQFFAGRLSRQLGQFQAAESHFLKALELAPDGEQRDACLWYLFDGALKQSWQSATEQLGRLAPNWQTAADFDALLDTLSRMMISTGNWEALLKIFPLIESYASEAATARYAYLIARAVETERLSSDDLEAYFGQAAPERQPGGRLAAAHYFFNRCFNTDSASLYYRGLAAIRLGKSLADELPPAGPAIRLNSAERNFITGFFKSDLADLAYSYAENLAPTLNEAVISLIASDFAAADRPGESIRLMANLQRRSGFQPTRPQMELLYPRPFLTVLTAAASRWSVPEPLLLALIRTESLFFPDIISRAGAVGLTQLLPTTADDSARRIRSLVNLKYLDGNLDLTDPLTNVELGTWYLADLKARTDSWLLALLAYNGGLSRVRQWRAAQAQLPLDLFVETVPIEETRNYVKQLLAAAVVYSRLYYGESPETMIAKAIGWLPDD